MRLLWPAKTVYEEELSELSNHYALGANVARGFSQRTEQVPEKRK
jgi:hypothetical protein